MPCFVGRGPLSAPAQRFDHPSFRIRLAQTGVPACPDPMSGGANGVASDGEAVSRKCKRDKEFDTPCPSLSSDVSGGGGIRTHGTPEGYTGFRDRPFQPLRHPSFSSIKAAIEPVRSGRFQLALVHTLRNGLRSWKNSLSSSPHSRAITPAVISQRWLSRGSETTW